jgi:hypothetical protein
MPNRARARSSQLAGQECGALCLIAFRNPSIGFGLAPRRLGGAELGCAIWSPTPPSGKAQGTFQGIGAFESRRVLERPSGPATPYSVIGVSGTRIDLASRMDSGAIASGTSPASGERRGTMAASNFTSLASRLPLWEMVVSACCHCRASFAQVGPLVGGSPISAAENHPCSVIDGKWKRGS